MLRSRRFWILTAVVSLLLIGRSPIGVAQVQTKHFQSNVESVVKPWTRLDFFNDPMNFKFAIVGDRTGGLRPGIFADGVKKLNLLMPEFVMSVGDFIPGNTADRTRLAKEWKEFDEVLKPLKVPFFFVPGNHDINNDVMRDVWKERRGVPFYSFVYKNVLFLALDTTGEKGHIVPDHQVEHMKNVLEKHNHVRWTFVFMHHPLWLYDDPAGFTKIQGLLEGRRHTVIAGHTHHYLHEWRNNANYYILATTGGGSELRGTRYGEFDHVTLITVSNDGPIMANLRLDGILPHDVTTRSDLERTQALLRSTNLPCTVLTDGEDAVTAGTLYLTLRNPSENVLHVKAQFRHGHQVQLEPQRIEMAIAEKSEKVVKVTVETSEAVPTDNPVHLQLDWTMGYQLNDDEDLLLSGTRPIPLRPSSANLIATVAPEFVDHLSVAANQPDNGGTLRFTTDGKKPTLASPTYHAAFTIDEATTFRVRMFNENGHGTKTSTQSYKPVPAGTGLRYRFYKGSWTRIPDFDTLVPVYEGVATDLNVESRQLWADNWGMVLDGDFEIEKKGTYSFFLNSDDGSMLYIDGKRIIDNDGDHSLLELGGSSELSVGSHQIRIEFFEAGGEAILELDVEGPGMPRQPLPFERVSHGRTNRS